MPICDKCGADVRKVTKHAKTRQDLCLRCITESGYYSFEDSEVLRTDDRRKSIRIPMTVVLNFQLDGAPGKQPAFTADLSMTGVCFAWDACRVCHSNVENTIAEQCILYPYYVRNPERRKLALELKVGERITLIMDTFAVHAYRDNEIGIEYVGAEFTRINLENKLILQKIVIGAAGEKR